jgi:hypothetical protein
VITLLFWGYLQFYIIFLLAYLSPTQEILIAVNRYNEANWELVLYTGFFIMGFVSLLFFYWERIAKTKRELISYLLFVSFLVGVTFLVFYFSKPLTDMLIFGRI